MRTFDTGATRDTDQGKLDYEGFLSPLALRRFAEYMNKNRVQKDGTTRDSDNWQKGIPMPAYMKSGWRHFFDWWELHRASLDEALTPEGEEALEEALTALLFNVQGYLHEHLKRKQSSESWLLKQAILAQNAETRERRELINAVVEGAESVDDTYIPDLRLRQEGAILADEPDPVLRGFAFHRHLEGSPSGVVDTGGSAPKSFPDRWDKIRRG